MNDREEQARRNREDFPFAYEKLGELQAVFGSGVKVTYARENGKEIGKRIDESRYHVVTAGEMMLETRRMDEIRNRGKR